MMNGDVMSGMAGVWFFGILALVGLILLAVVLVKSVSGNSKSIEGLDTSDGDRPRLRRGREILDERYARGELSAEEYREMRRELEGSDR